MRQPEVIFAKFLLVLPELTRILSHGNLILPILAIAQPATKLNTQIEF